MTRKRPQRRTRTATTSQSRVLKPVRVGASVALLGRRLLVQALALGLGLGLGFATAQDAAKQPDSPSPYKGAPYAVIFGTVWAADSHAVYGVHLQLRRAGEKKVRWEAYSDHRGEFAFRVPPGKADYELSADPKSLKSMKNKHFNDPGPVKVHVEYDEQVDTGLHLTQ